MALVPESTGESSRARMTAFMMGDWIAGVPRRAGCWRRAGGMLEKSGREFEGRVGERPAMRDAFPQGGILGAVSGEEEVECDDVRGPT